MYYPTLEEAKKLYQEGHFGRIPISFEILSDELTPILVLKKLKKVNSHCFLLESVDDAKRWGRYTFLGFQPSLEISCTDHILTVKSSDTKETLEVDHPNQYLRSLLKNNRSPKLSHLPPFCGGLVGYFSYDYIKYSEPSLHLDASDEENFKDMDLMMFDRVIAFDHFRQKIILIVNIKTACLESEYEKAVRELAAMEQLLTEGECVKVSPLRLKSTFSALFSQEEYCHMVEKGRHYIKEGDIFQVVLSNRLEAEAEGSILNAYRLLRTLNPSPYMFYFSSDDLEMAGASPETLVKLQGDKLFTFPLAGTRPRGQTIDEDEALKKELLEDEKELAEHNMLVDLGRNDIGRISQFGSVHVEQYLQIQSFSHVMHIGSVVSGTIDHGKDALDAIDAILPAGTLSGAPKIRACQIINELEASKRGVYGGAIGYIDFSGNLDTCIAIRLAIKKNGKVFIRSGAGIVADSVAEKEYQECMNKAMAVKKALLRAAEMNREEAL